LKHQIFFSIDVEEWFQVENLKKAIPRSSWSNQVFRVEGSLRLILEIFETFDIKATFFVLGWVAKRNPALVRFIYDHGHEIACHGYSHNIISNQTCEEFRKDISDSKNMIEDIISDKVIGYRAPSFSITDWSIDILKEAGFVYDSSLFPFKMHDRYGRIQRKKTIIENNIFEFDNGLLEISLPVLNLLNINVPLAGGFYFRFFPYWLFRYGINANINLKNNFVFYLHPWEIDYEQPKLRQLGCLYKFRHYWNIKKTRHKLKKICTDYGSCLIREKALILRGG